MTTFTLNITSNLPAPLADVWHKVSTMEGVNDELTPFIRMTSPNGMRRLPFTHASSKQPLFASWLLLFGVLPFDRHQLRLDEVWEGGFRENSYSLIHRVWRHERVIVPNNLSCTLTDTVRFEPRVPLLGYVLLPVIRFIFQHRHKRLQQWFSLQRTRIEGED